MKVLSKKWGRKKQKIGEGYWIESCYLLTTIASTKYIDLSQIVFGNLTYIVRNLWNIHLQVVAKTIAGIAIRQTNFIHERMKHDFLGREKRINVTCNNNVSLYRKSPYLKRLKYGEHQKHIWAAKNTTFHRDTKNHGLWNNRTDWSGFHPRKIPLNNRLGPFFFANLKPKK